MLVDTKVQQRLMWLTLQCTCHIRDLFQVPGNLQGHLEFDTGLTSSILLHRECLCTA